ncbi:MAG: hypothetical protein U9R27_10740 [Campylobacterota bacterium]|nr:hypothetical protein [Campylobacterota bacterium]
MKLSLEEILRQDSGKKILFLGREEFFSHEESQSFLKRFDKVLTTRFDEDVVAVVEHHRLNPVEEDISYLAYDQKIPLYRLDEFERLMSHSIEENSVLMSLKLSSDQKRIYRLINNTHISDLLFIKLLEIYQWSEDEEDNNEDRGVVMATLRRFLNYKSSEEDLLYSSLTLRRLIGETTNPTLLKALLTFPNYRFMQKNKQSISLREVIAANPYIDADSIQKMLRYRDDKILFYLAANSSVSLALLKQLSNKNLTEINRALSSNTTIDDELFAKLLSEEEGVGQRLLAYQPITVARFDMIKERGLSAEIYAILGENLHLDIEVSKQLLKEENALLREQLALNPSMSSDILTKIYEIGDETLYPMLSTNPSTPTAILTDLYSNYRDDPSTLSSLSYNSSTPIYILKELFDMDSFEINKGLASNPSLPLELLNALKIDTRLRNALTSNKTLTDSMTRKL